MTIRQSRAGTWDGTAFTVTFDAATQASGTTVAIFCLGNTVVNTPTGFTAPTDGQTSSVVNAGLYLFNRAGDGATSYSFTANAGQGMWAAYEINGAFLSATAAQTSSAGTTYATGTVTPTAGSRVLVAGVGSLDQTNLTRSTSTFTDSFVERFDLQSATGIDRPQGATADQVVTASGSTAYGTTATWNVSAGTRGGIVAAYTSVAPATAPTVSAGADVTGHVNNTTFTRTATETANGTISARSWSVVSGPAQVGATLATAAALSWTPTTAGTYVLRYSATNEHGTSTDDMSITVVNAQVLTPASVVSSTGVTVTGAADIVAALDSNDTASYATVDAGETLEVLLDTASLPADRTGQALTYTVSGTGTATLALYEGATLRASETRALTGTATTFTFNLSAAQAESFTAYTDVRLRITVS